MKTPGPGLQTSIAHSIISEDRGAENRVTTRALPAAYKAEIKPLAGSTVLIVYYCSLPSWLALIPARRPILVCSRGGDGGVAGQVKAGIDAAKKMIDQGGDWDRRNRLKVRTSFFLGTINPDR